MPTIEHTLRIHAPLDAVLAAVSTDDGIRSWLSPDLEGSIADGQTAPGRFSDRETFGWKTDADQPEHTVRWTCVSGPGAAAGSSVTFELSADGDDTRVDLAHAGWPEEGHPAFATCNTLWGMLLGRLKGYAEQHVPAPAFP